LRCDGFVADLQDGSVVVGGGRRGSGPGRWWYVEAAASVSHTATVLWGAGSWPSDKGIDNRTRQLSTPEAR
jgi:hypothetical protein